MTLPTISALPTAPSRTDPSTFAARGDAFVAALATLRSEINSWGTALAAELLPYALAADNVGQFVQFGSPTTISGSPSTVDFVHGTSGVVLSSTYDVVMIELQGVKPGTDATTLCLRTSTNAGSAWDAGASDYSYSKSDVVAGTPGGTSSDTEIELGTLVGNATDEEGVSGRIWLYRPSDAKPCVVHWDLVYRNSTAGVPTAVRGAGIRKAAANVDGVRLFFSSGTLSAGVITMYGRNKS